MANRNVISILGGYAPPANGKASYASPFQKPKKDNLEAVIATNFNQKNDLYQNLNAIESLAIDTLCPNAYMWEQISGSSQDIVRGYLYKEAFYELSQRPLYADTLYELASTTVPHSLRTEPHRTRSRRLITPPKNPLYKMVANYVRELLHHDELKPKLAACESTIEVALVILTDVNLQYSQRKDAVLDQINNKNIRELAVYSASSLRQSTRIP